MKILVVEDDVVIQRLLQAQLSHAGYEVVLAANGRQAWTVLQHQPIQLVITDWMMPEMDGPELIRRIRATESTRYIYIILLTSRDEKSDLLAGLDAGADDYLVKSTERDELWARVAIGKRVIAAEQALQASEARYRAIVEDQTELISRFLSDTTLTFANEAYYRYFGKPRETLIGHTFIQDIFDEDREKVARHLAALSPDNPVASIEERVVLPNGEVRWQQWTTRAVFDDGDKLIEYQSVGRDITERKQAEAALRKNEARLLSAQRVARLGLWEWDIITGDLYWSDEHYRILGFSPQAFTPTQGTFLNSVHPDDREFMLQHLNVVVQGNVEYNIDHRIVRP
ncbi:MAG: response regulator, partial [Chloroflexi bacterium]|nr:response regulator [Chloroflexota bacterium]